jgi:surface polysaccharide O-acyltransferase-like enzyme
MSKQSINITSSYLICHEMTVGVMWHIYFKITHTYIHTPFKKNIYIYFNVFYYILFYFLNFLLRHGVTCQVLKGIDVNFCQFIDGSWTE